MNQQTLEQVREALHDAYLAIDWLHGKYAVGDVGVNAQMKLVAALNLLSALSSASQAEQEVESKAVVTYAHKDGCPNIRFRQYADDKLPSWAVDVKPEAPDQNVEDLREMLLQRSQVGLSKYGCTTMRSDLSLQDWLQHALEETLDNAVYLRAAIRKVADDERADQEGKNE